MVRLVRNVESELIYLILISNLEISTEFCAFRKNNCARSLIKAKANAFHSEY